MLELGVSVGYKQGCLLVNGNSCVDNFRLNCLFVDNRYHSFMHVVVNVLSSDSWCN